MRRRKIKLSRKITEAVRNLDTSVLYVSVAALGLITGFVLFNTAGFEGKAMVVAADGQNVAAVTPVVFKDEIPEWAGDAIQNLNSAGILKGYENGKFGPGDNLTRGQVMTVLQRMLNFRNITTGVDTSKCNVYSDVSSSDFFYQGACIFKQSADSSGLGTSGLGGSNFDPNRQVTRGEAAQMLDALMGSTILEALGISRSHAQIYADVPLNSEFNRGVLLAFAAGLMKGDPGGTFSPERPLNRAEMAVIMDRNLNLLQRYKIVKLLEPLQSDAYLTECSGLINEKMSDCGSLPNWSMVIKVTKTSLVTGKKEIVLNNVENGAGNRCTEAQAMTKYPVYIGSSTLTETNLEGTDKVSLLCDVSCSAWKCPSTEDPKCAAGSEPTRDCLESCSGTCESVSGQTGCSVCKEDEPVTPEPEPEPTPSNNCGAMPVYPNCRLQCAGKPSYPTFEFEDCLTKCDAQYNADLDTYSRCMDPSWPSV